MPVAHIQCCDSVFTIEEALAHVATRRNRCQWTFELLTAMFATSVAHPSNEDPTRISTTVLTQDCLRSVALERFNDTTSTPDKMWAAFRGTMFHKQMEPHAAPNSYGEARFYVKDLGTKIPAVKKALPGRTDRSFSGSPDLVDPVAGVLYDYKRTKEVPRFNTVWSNHSEQNNINRWLVDHADTVEMQESAERWQEIADTDFDLDQFPGLVSVGANRRCTWDLLDPEVRARFVPVEWQELVIVYVDDKGPKPIAVTKSIQVPKVGGVGTKAARVADVWDDEQAEAFIAQRYIAARNALTTRSAPIPVGWEHQGKPLCNFCDAKGICAELERKGE